MKSHNATIRPNVSILMPVYNASKYLQQALNSIARQTLDDIEIICINDGSTDNSLDIISDYAKMDRRISIINKSNSGYGDSMNMGLNIAKGKYIAILEPDDWYDQNMLRELYDLATKHALDVAKGGFYQYSQRTNADEQCNLFKKSQCNRVINNSENDFIYFLQPSIWSAIYRLHFLKKNKISFLDTPGASYQDTSFNFKVFTMAKRAMFINDPLVHYRIDNNNSSINNIAKKLPYIDKEYDEIDNFIKHIPRIKTNVNIQKIANSCRFLTYQWAMEQLDGKLLHNYILHAHNALQRNDLTSYYGLSNDQHKDLVRLINNPNKYYLCKQLRLNIHRLKSSICYTLK